MQATACPSRISRLILRHKRIDSLISSYPNCPLHISLEVDRLMVEAENETSYFLEN